LRVIEVVKGRVVVELSNQETMREQRGYGRAKEEVKKAQKQIQEFCGGGEVIEKIKKSTFKKYEKKRKNGKRTWGGVDRGKTQTRRGGMIGNYGDGNGPFEECKRVMTGPNIVGVSLFSSKLP